MPTELSGNEAPKSSNDKEIPFHEIPRAFPREEDDERPGPSNPLEWLVGFFGMPFEHGVEGPAKRPLATWGVVGLLVLASLWGFWDENVLDEFGMIPEQIKRYGGATLLTSFFLHGGFMHLFGNAYFLLLFGDNVEDHVGKLRLLGLLLFSTLLGDAIHIALDPRGDIPVIGASGGIAGVMSYYAFQYPHARLRMQNPRYEHLVRWIEFPAWTGMLVWAALQVYGLLRQVSGYGHVSAAAHLGGAAAGVLWWLFWRRKIEAEEAFGALEGK
ncbi:MAG: rhomboid family intramembrane serine protease [Bdellovibrionota bacterium]